MPTFQFYVGKARVDTVRGADANELERKVKHWAESTAAASNDGDDGAPSGPAGQVKLKAYILMGCLRFFHIITFALITYGKCIEIKSKKYEKPPKLIGMVMDCPKKKKHVLFYQMF